MPNPHNGRWNEWIEHTQQLLAYGVNDIAGAGKKY
jgi:hypothetical protein